MVEVSIFPNTRKARARFVQSADRDVCWVNIESDGGKLIIYGNRAQSEKLQMMVAVFNDAFSPDAQADQSVEALTYLEAAQ